MAIARKILCTGGLGYIGSHCALLLAEEGFDVTIVDKVQNDLAAEVKRNLQVISKGKIEHITLDLLDYSAVSNLFKTHSFDGVIHFAASKCVEESVQNPLLYYKNNLLSSINLLKAMNETKCKTMVFSSSAAIYESKKELITEIDEIRPGNPYGHTKQMIEQILNDLFISDNSWNIIILRYFNPIGAHPSGLIGELYDRPRNILSCILEVASGRQEFLNVHGDDWDTEDGTGVRDYIHIIDLVQGHSSALKKVLTSSFGMCTAYNLGTGKGVSVLELIKLFEKATGTNIPYHIVGRRAGDTAASVVADASKAREELDWVATRSIEDACATSWRWMLQNMTPKKSPERSQYGRQNLIYGSGLQYRLPFQVWNEMKK